MASLESLTAALDKQPNLQACVACLIDGLCERIKATSNDQNIQTLARDLKAAAPEFLRVLSSKQAG